MKKIGVGIFLLICVIVYQLAFSSVIESSDEAKFLRSIGLLSDNLKPYERDYLELIHNRISKFEKDRFNSKEVYMSQKEENLRSFYYKSLNKLTEKYLDYQTYSYDDTPTHLFDDKSSENSKIDSRIDLKISNLFLRLKPLISDKDFTEIKKLYEDFDENQNYETLDKIDKILSYYDELYSYFIVEYLIEPTDVKAYFEVDDQKNIIYSSIYPVIETEPTDDELKTYYKLWNHIKSSVGIEMIESVDKFLVFSDGRNNTLAYVNYSDSYGSNWYMAVDIADSYRGSSSLMQEEFYYTIVHELAHVFTLNEKQVSYDKEPLFMQYFEDSLVANKESYLNEFYIRFWKDFIEETRIIKMEDIYDNSYRFFLRHETDFVSDYAANDPIEDIAESFAYFVTSDKPLGNDVWEQKIRFFYEYEELVNIRNIIRKHLQEVKDAA